VTPKQLSPYDPGHVSADKSTKKKTVLLSISSVQTHDVTTATARIVAYIYLFCDRTNVKNLQINSPCGIFDGQSDNGQVYLTVGYFGFTMSINSTNVSYAYFTHVSSTLPNVSN
jgi:hypothetical protein